MNLALFANVLTILFCTAVLVQSVRMMRSLRTVKDGALTQVVQALEKATGQARAVLSDMKTTLGTDCAQHARLVEQARALRDELSVMTGIADAACERIVNAVGIANSLRSPETGEAKAEDEIVAEPAEIVSNDVIAEAIDEAKAEAAAQAPVRVESSKAERARAKARLAEALRAQFRSEAA